MAYNKPTIKTCKHYKTASSWMLVNILYFDDKNRCFFHWSNGAICTKASLYGKVGMEKQPFIADRKDWNEKLYWFTFSFLDLHTKKKLRENTFEINHWHGYIMEKVARDTDVTVYVFPSIHKMKMRFQTAT